MVSIKTISKPAKFIGAALVIVGAAGGLYTWYCLYTGKNPYPIKDPNSTAPQVQTAPAVVSGPNQPAPAVVSGPNQPVLPIAQAPISSAAPAPQPTGPQGPQQPQQVITQSYKQSPSYMQNRKEINELYIRKDPNAANQTLERLCSNIYTGRIDRGTDKKLYYIVTITPEISDAIISRDQTKIQNALGVSYVRDLSQILADTFRLYAPGMNVESVNKVDGKEGIDLDRRARIVPIIIQQPPPGPQTGTINLPGAQYDILVHTVPD